MKPVEPGCEERAAVSKPPLAARKQTRPQDLFLGSAALNALNPLFGGHIGGECCVTG